MSDVIAPDNACEDCKASADDVPFACMVEAMETFGELLCDSCFDARCEAAWERM